VAGPQTKVFISILVLRIANKRTSLTFTEEYEDLTVFVGDIFYITASFSNFY